jgi:hypothetical protein
MSNARVMRLASNGIRVVGWLILVSVIGVVSWYLLWFLEYYHLPPISFLKVESGHAELIDGIESYQNIANVKKYLASRSLVWEEVEARKSTDVGRPPFNIDTITVKSYMHVGFVGDLKLTFFNDRLMATTFFSDDHEKVIRALQDKGMKFDSNQEAMLAPHTRVRQGTYYNEGAYIEWFDIRLDREAELWITRYS